MAQGLYVRCRMYLKQLLQCVNTDFVIPPRVRYHQWQEMLHCAIEKFAPENGPMSLSSFEDWCQLYVEAKAFLCIEFIVRGLAFIVVSAC
jgi:hypothetical protein